MNWSPPELPLPRGCPPQRDREGRTQSRLPGHLVSSCSVTARGRLGSPHFAGEDTGGLETRESPKVPQQNCESDTSAGFLKPSPSSAPPLPAESEGVRMSPQSQLLSDKESWGVPLPTFLLSVALSFPRKHWCLPSCLEGSSNGERP